jgi:hypothetical protein
MENYICETCSNKGWIETSVFNSSKIANETLVIEKCDDCNIFISDFAAATFAFEKENIFSFRTDDGFNVKINFSLN